MDIKFTDAQKLACDISRNIAVTAGAGSGKTSVLVRRYLWCLENTNYDVRRVAAITFTEKAAGEMLQRVRQSVLDRIEKGLGDIQRWEMVLEHLALANISTIHGFCQRLLREFPIEAGVDPKFEILDEALKRITLRGLVSDALRQRSAAHDPDLSALAELWTPATLTEVLQHLIAFRTRSLPWAEWITACDFAEYASSLTTLIEETQRRGVRQIVTDRQWADTITLIRGLIPEGDSSKLTFRSQNILDYDRQFRTQTNLSDQLLTLQMLHKECRMITPSAKWKEDERNVRLSAAFQWLKARYEECLPELLFREGLEESGFRLQQSLARIFLAVYADYQQEKIARRVLDFDDLQECALRLLEQPEIHALLARRYDYLMVDEFQDTNQLQWEIISRLGRTTEGALESDKFCIVGDEKQSIYLFRGADVAVFEEVKQQLRQTNAASDVASLPLKMPALGELPIVADDQKNGMIVMAENFRSIPPLIFFCNYLFARLFPATFDAERPYNVPHQELIACREPGHQCPGSELKQAEACSETEDASASLSSEPGALAPGYPVEFLLAIPSEESSKNAKSSLEEPELVALRIRELTPQFRYKDMAILLRTRTRLKEFEEALRQSDIPFVVAGGIGFFQQQEIYDLANLLRFLMDERQDIALAGVLRSPLFSFSDDQLFFLAEQPGVQDLSCDSMQNKFCTPGPALWQKLVRCVQFVERQADAIPAELEPQAFVHAYALLTAWKAQADRIPMTHLLRQILEDTGLYGILAASRRNIQSFINIEKLLDLARNFESLGFQSLHDFVSYLDQLIEIEEREGEAQLNVEGMDVVRLMTIHAAKGLEFPVVFVPEVERPFNYGASESLYMDAVRITGDLTPAVGIKGLDPDQDYAPENTLLRNYLKRMNAEKTDAEMKRIFYVACTRARDHLILSGTLAENISKSSWLDWLIGIFPLQEAVAQGAFQIAEDATEHRELTIPVLTSSRYKNHGDTENTEKEKIYAGHSVASVSPWFKESQGHEEIARILRQNFQPLGGETMFRVNPSTLYLLFQCPQKYYYQHILRLPETFFCDQNMSGATDELSDENANLLAEQQPSAALRGTIIHKLFELQSFDQANDATQLAASINMVLDMFRISSQDRQTMHLETAIQRAYQTYQTTGIRDLLANASQIYREYEFALRLGPADITGTFDVLFFDPQRECWTILDYKTNEVESGQVIAEIAKHGYDAQMRMYALAVSRLLHVEQVRSLLFFTSPGVVHEIADLSPSALNAFEAKLSHAVRQLADGIIERAPTPETCQECGYASVCRDTPH